jgi:hypothetical protein
MKRGRYKMADYLPNRDTGLCFQIDTNRINSRQKDKQMNQIEKWNNDGVIFLYLTEPVVREAKKGNSELRKKKVQRIGPKMETLASTAEEKIMREISMILFNRLPVNENERNDVEIVFNAKKYAGSLITEDGDSKRQPNGILGRRQELKRKLGVNIFRTLEAVNLIEKRIRLRDDRVRNYCENSCEQLPDWVGKDFFIF